MKLFNPSAKQMNLLKHADNSTGKMYIGFLFCLVIHNSQARIVPVRGAPNMELKKAATPLAIAVALFLFFKSKNFDMYVPTPPPIFIGVSNLPTEAPAKCERVVVMNSSGTV